MGKKKERGNGEGTVYQKPDGTWVAQVSVGINRATGKPKRRTFTDKIRSEVVKKRNEVLVELEKGTYIEPATVTLEKWLNDWLEGRRPPIKALNTWRGYDSIIRVHINPNIGKEKLKNLTTREIQSLINKKCAEVDKKGNPKLSPRQVRYIHQTLNAALGQAVKERVIPFNPAEYCELPGLEHKEAKVLNPNELAIFFETAQQESPHSTAFYLDISTGMRRGELLGLTWDCVDFKERTILIKQQVINGENNVPVITGLKTKKSRRTVSVDTDTIGLLKFHQKRQENHKAKVSIYHEKNNPTGLYHDNNLVFATDEGKLVNPRTFSKHFSRLLKKAGLSGTRLHDLRHLHATLALENGIDLKTVSANLGHSSIKITGDIYAHVTEEMRDNLAKKVGGALAACIKK